MRPALESGVIDERDECWICGGQWAPGPEWPPAGGRGAEAQLCRSKVFRAGLWRIPDYFLIGEAS